MDEAAERIASQDFGRVHLFEVGSRKLCLDVNSARVIRLSAEAWDALRVLSNAAQGRDLPESALRELVERIDAGNLFTEPVPYDPALHPVPQVESAILNLTHNCNLGCKYCFMEFPDVREHYGGSRRRMSDETARASIDFVRAHSRPGTTITFFGGEPLLEFSLLRRVVEDAESRFPGWFRWNVITNGTRLGEDVQSYLDERNVSVIVSIDGAKETHDRLRPYKGQAGRGSYDDIMSNVARLEGRDAGLKVNITYASQTTDILESYQDLRAKGVATVRLEKAAVPAGDPLAVRPEQLDGVRAGLGEIAANHLEELVRGEAASIDNFADVVYRVNAGGPRRRGCDTGLGYIAIAADGVIYPCHKFIGDLRFRIGSVFDETFDPTFGRAIWDRPVETRNVCDACWARTICGGYCVADNFLRTGGDFFTPDPTSCDVIRTTVELGVWLHEELRDTAPEALRRALGWKFVLGSDQPVRNPQAVVVSRDPLIVELHGTRYELNAMAEEVWRACDGGHRAHAIPARIAERFPYVDRRLVDDDVADALTKLVANGLIATEASLPRLLEHQMVLAAGRERAPAGSPATSRRRLPLAVLTDDCGGCGGG